MGESVYGPFFVDSVAFDRFGATGDRFQIGSHTRARTRGSAVSHIRQALGNVDSMLVAFSRKLVVPGFSEAGLAGPRMAGAPIECFEASGHAPITQNRRGLIADFPRVISGDMW